MKFRFPIVIIDEDFRSENTSGLGIRALAKAMEDEDMEVLGVTSYGDLSQFAQQHKRISSGAHQIGSGNKIYMPVPHLPDGIYWRLRWQVLRFCLFCSGQLSRAGQYLAPQSSFRSRLLLVVLQQHSYPIERLQCQVNQLRTNCQLPVAHFVER